MNLINKLVVCFVLLSGLSAQIRAQDKPFDLASPNAGLKISIGLGDIIYYAITGNNQELLSKNALSLTLKGEVLGENAKLISLPAY
ncbi:hypothetical protein [Dyadobacter arcticus]|uniref:Uncharacterized protein n=1 Tax=Dyadobacter arcticus TaxID=1078754 RepID=A0ABX0UNV0_9BACT|nr:hypothetical protein [Dyadobacter arcticus]NIJ54668.1 hypothetical protein [Dyadobacter arcticus]